MNNSYVIEKKSGLEALWLLRVYYHESDGGTVSMEHFGKFHPTVGRGCCSGTQYSHKVQKGFLGRGRYWRASRAMLFLSGSHACLCFDFCLFSQEQVKGMCQLVLLLKLEMECL